ncbi:hypothetical protein Pla175_06810 [Pirellulimonas nuda]|uniref:Uncharacterized protein n=1 Tax=Pirellulimonas nuda TaxID=2528009 RepID=A0A518D759_9BACT|nr:hypothetical protein Pla175_06810 [Pirellulimonas nuda]
MRSDAHKLSLGELPRTKGPTVRRLPKRLGFRAKVLIGAVALLSGAIACLASRTVVTYATARATSGPVDHLSVGLMIGFCFGAAIGYYLLIRVARSVFFRLIARFSR